MLEIYDWDQHQNQWTPQLHYMIYRRTNDYWYIIIHHTVHTDRNFGTLAKFALYYERPRISEITSPPKLPALSYSRMDYTHHVNSKTHTSPRTCSKGCPIMCQKKMLYKQFKLIRVTLQKDSLTFFIHDSTSSKDEKNVSSYFTIIVDVYAHVPRNGKFQVGIYRYSHHVQNISIN